MAVVNPPWALEQLATHHANVNRSGLALLTGLTEGVVSGYGTVTNLGVTQRGAGANMSVDVAAGACIVFGDDSQQQGIYACVNDATVNLVISASDPSHDRWDLIIARVKDAFYSGATNAWSLEVVAGVAAASPADPTIPHNAVVLARVVVGAGVSSITTAVCADLRPFVARGIVPMNSARRPGQAYGAFSQEAAFKPIPSDGLLGIEVDTHRIMYYDLAAGIWQYAAGGASPLFSARAYGGAQNIAGTATTTLLNLNAEDYDPNSNFNTTTHTYTCPATRLYRFHGTYICQLTDTTAQRTYIVLFKNGAEICRGTDLTIRGGTANDVLTFAVDDELPFAAADVIDLRCFGATSGGGNITGAGGSSVFGPSLSIRAV